MADSTKLTKKTVQQLYADTVVSLRKVGQQVLPRLGYIYILLLVCSLAYVVSTVNQTFDSADALSSSDTAPLPGADITTTNFTMSFDTATIAKVKALNGNTTNMNVSLPSGRINPFAE